MNALMAQSAHAYPPLQLDFAEVPFKVGAAVDLLRY
jgi:hypothetical protein